MKSWLPFCTGFTSGVCPGPCLCQALFFFTVGRQGSSGTQPGGQPRSRQHPNTQASLQAEPSWSRRGLTHPPPSLPAPSPTISPLTPPCTCQAPGSVTTPRARAAWDLAEGVSHQRHLRGSPTKVGLWDTSPLTSI